MTSTPPAYHLRAACIAAELRAAAQSAAATDNPRLAALLEQRARYWDQIEDDAAEESPA